MPQPSSPLTLETLLEHSAWVRRLAHSLVSDSSLADDIEQRTWQAAIEHPPQQHGNPKAWLGTVMRNLVKMHWRKHGARRRREEAQGTKRWRDQMANAVNQRPENLAERMDTVGLLAQAFLQLEEPYKTTLFLRYFEELSLRTIALRLGDSESVIKTRLKRALALLRQELPESLGEEWRQRCLVFTVPLAATPSIIVSTVVTMAIKTKLALSAAAIAAVALFFIQPWDTNSKPIPGEDAIASAALPASENLKEISGVENTQPLRSPINNPLEPTLPLLLDSDLDLHGLVVDATGQPIPGASITIQQPLQRQAGAVRPLFEPDSKSIAVLLTDAEGRFRMRLEPTILYDVDVDASGYAQIRKAGVYAGEFLFVELSEAASIYGCITDKETSVPIQGVEIVASHGVLNGAGYKQYFATTDALGNYQLTNLPNGHIQTYFRANGFVGGPVTMHSLEIGENLQVDFQLDSGRTISGVIFDARNQLPIEGATVQAYGSFGQKAITDAGGHYVLRGLDEGLSRSLHASAPGFGRYDYPVSYIPEEGLEITLGLRPGRSATGRLVDSDGNPISRAYLAASGSRWRPGYQDQDQVFTRSKKDGTFVFTDLRIDLRHSLLVSALEFGSEVFDFPETEWHAQELDLGDLVLLPAASITGQLVDLSGNPMEGLFVTLSGESKRRDSLTPSMTPQQGYAWNRGYGLGQVQARTDARGRFSFPNLPAGDFHLWAGAKGFVKGAELDLSLDAGERIENLNFIFDVGLSISGVLRNELGGTLPAIVVDLISMKDLAHRITYTLSDGKGFFTLRGLEPGSYILECNSFGHLGSNSAAYVAVSVADVLAGTEDLEIIIPEALATTGIVVDLDGQPVPMVNISNKWKSNFVCEATTGKDGRFSLWMPPNRSTELHFYPAPDHAPGQWAWHYDVENKIDMSWDFIVTDLVAGSQDNIIILPKVPQSE